MNSKVFKSPRQIGIGLSNSQYKSARKLTSPRPRIKSSTNDFVLVRLMLPLGITNQGTRNLSDPYGSMLWLYTTSAAEIGRTDHIVASQRIQHRKYHCISGRDSDLRGVQS